MAHVRLKVSAGNGEDIERGPALLGELPISPFSHFRLVSEGVSRGLIFEWVCRCILILLIAYRRNIMASSMPVSTSSINLTATTSSISMGSESDQQYRTALSRSASNASSLQSRCTVARPDQMSSAATSTSGKKGGECPESDQEAGVSKKVYVSKKIIQKAFTVLNDFRTQNLLSDVTIRVGSRDFTAHRVILAATSPYFQAMFTSKNSNKVTIQQENKGCMRVMFCNGISYYILYHYS